MSPAADKPRWTKPPLGRCGEGGFKSSPRSMDQIMAGQFDWRQAGLRWDAWPRRRAWLAGLESESSAWRQSGAETLRSGRYGLSARLRQAQPERVREREGERERKRAFSGSERKFPEPAARPSGASLRCAAKLRSDPKNHSSAPSPVPAPAPGPEFAPLPQTLVDAPRSAGKSGSGTAIV